MTYPGEIFPGSIEVDMPKIVFLAKTLDVQGYTLPEIALAFGILLGDRVKTKEELSQRLHDSYMIACANATELGVK